MRRSEKEMTDEAARAVLAEGMVCRLAMVDNGRPYGVPLNYGYVPGVLYFHSAPDGRKIEAMRRDPHVSFEVTVDTRTVPGNRICKWGMGFRCVIGSGAVTFVDGVEEKRDALAAIAAQCGAPGETLADTVVEAITVFRVDIEEMVGKQSGPEPIDD